MALQLLRFIVYWACAGKYQVLMLAVIIIFRDVQVGAMVVDRCNYETISLPS